MAVAELDGDRIVVEVEYRDRDMVREVPGAKWVRDRTWRCPRTWAVCLALRGVFGDRLEVGPELEEWAWTELETRVRPATELRERAMDVDADSEWVRSNLEFGGLLRQSQRTGVDFLHQAWDAVLGDDMGLGKTVQAIAALELSDSYPALVVCPKSVKQTWADEYAKWAPHRDVLVASKPRDFTATPDVLVVNWESLRTHSRLAGYGSIRLTEKDREEKALNRDWAVVVADEAHRAKNPTAKQTRALWGIGRTARRRIAMTGTPVANEPQDFWSLLHFIAPDEWPSRSSFMDRYCLMTSALWGGVEVLGLRPDTKDEFYRAVDSRFLRRSKELVARDLPPKTYVTRETPMSPKQAQAYKQMCDSQVAWLGDDAVAAFDPLTVLTRQLQFAAAYAEVTGETVTLQDPSCKVDGVLDLLEDMPSSEQLVVFAQSRQLIDLCEARLIKNGVTCGRVTGSENEQQRNAAVRRFQSGDLRVILLTLGAGSTGITLTSASTLCFLQRSFNQVDNLQAEDRVHRIGQAAETVTIVDLITPGTVEETIVKPALQNKSFILSEITRDRDALRRALAAPQHT